MMRGQWVHGNLYTIQSILLCSKRTKILKTKTTLNKRFQCSHSSGATEPQCLTQLHAGRSGCAAGGRGDGFCYVTPGYVLCFPVSQ